MEGFKNLFPPVLVPGFNFQKCFEDLVVKYPKKANPDLLKSYFNIVSLSKQSEKNILRKLLPGSRVDGPVIRDPHFGYYIRDSVRQSYRKGCWCTTDKRHEGSDLLSLVQFKKGCTKVEAFEFVAECLGESLFGVNVAQCRQYNGNEFICDSHWYPDDSQDSIENLILGQNFNVYTFLNNDLKPSFDLREWNNSPVGQIRLFATMQLDRKNYRTKFEYIAPPHKYMIYNRHLIDTNRNDWVNIHDNIARAKSSDPEGAIATWSGDLSISSRLDWRFLEGRTVSYIFNSKCKDSMLIGKGLINQLSEVGTSLRLYDASEYDSSVPTVSLS